MIHGTDESIAKQEKLLYSRRKRFRDDRTELGMPSQLGQFAERWTDYCTTAK